MTEEVVWTEMPASAVEAEQPLAFPGEAKGYILKPQASRDGTFAPGEEHWRAKVLGLPAPWDQLGCFHPGARKSDSPGAALDISDFFLNISALNL